MRTFEDIFSGDATSHVLEWPLGRVHKRAVESTVDTTDAMDAGDDDEESSSGIPLSAEEAAGFWLGDAAYPIQTCLLDGYHAIDRVGDRIPRPNTLREKFISRMRDVLYIICPEDVDEHSRPLALLGSAGPFDPTASGYSGEVGPKKRARRCCAECGWPQCGLGHELDGGRRVGGKRDHASLAGRRATAWGPCQVVVSDWNPDMPSGKRAKALLARAGRESSQALL